MLEMPRDALLGRFLPVLPQTVERARRDAGRAQAGGLPDGALGGPLLADQNLDCS